MPCLSRRRQSPSARCDFKHSVERVRDRDGLTRECSKPSDRCYAWPMRVLKTHDDHGILFEFIREDDGIYYVRSQGKMLVSFALMNTADGFRAFDVKVFEAPFEPRAATYVASFCAEVNAGTVRVD